MRKTSTKNPWVLLVLLLAGVVLGGFIGALAQNIEALKWLNYGQQFGLDAPIVLNLGMLILTFGLSIRITISSIIGIILAIFLYRVI